MPITTGHWGKAYYPGVEKWWGMDYPTIEKLYPKVMEVSDTDRQFIEEVSTSGFGLVPVKNPGTGVSYDVRQQGFVQRHTPVSYGLGFAVTYEAEQDDLYDVVARQGVKDLALSHAATEETVAALLFDRAFNSSYTFADGKEICATNHITIRGATYSNELTTAADFSEASLDQATIDIKKMTNDAGIRIKAMPKKLLIPVDVEPDVYRILQASGRPGTANLNEPNYHAGRFTEVVANPYLADTDAWFILTNIPGGPKFIWRQRPTMSDDNDWDTMNAKYKVFSRFVASFRDPRAIFGSPGA